MVTADRADGRHRRIAAHPLSHRRIAAHPLSMTAVCAVVAMLAGGVARAQELDRSFPISIGTVSVEEALRYIQLRTGVSIVFSPDQVRSRSVRGVKGNFTPVEAIENVLQGTGFMLRRNGNQLLIVAVPCAKDAYPAPESTEAAARDVPPLRPPVLGLPIIEEVIITGTRLTTGFETATPVTAITAESLLSASPTNIADSLRQLPALAATLSGSQTTSGTAAAGSNGQSLLNMRNLGTNRNLVLLNGRRTVASNVNNSVDMNVMPQNLISRVDVVTGGASAAYGSDAVAGVVNLILDTDFIGVKGEVGAGISTFGDMPNYKASLAWGGTFANDRLHIVASTQYARQEGTHVHEVSGRDWWDRPWGLISNTTGAGPQNLVLPDIRSSVGTNGGLITSGPLKGIQFLAGGRPAPFDYGYSAGTTWQSGGDGAWISFNLTPDQWRTANFAHVTYDLNDDTQVYAELGFSYANATDINQKPINTGARFNYTIFSGNPFLPPSIQAEMDARGVSSFTMGRYMMEYPDVTIVNSTRVMREAVGIKGRFGTWNYDVSYSHGRMNQRLAQNNLTIARPTYAAADAVVHPTTGRIVCRSQYYLGDTFVPGGTGLDPGCTPQNLFGPGAVAPETVAYAIGDSWKKFDLTQQVVMGTISGDLERVGLPAGPVSVAAGLEYRTEKGNQITDDLSVTSIDFTGIRGGPPILEGQRGPFRFANFQPFQGRYTVKEVFAEVGVPLLANKPMVRSLSTDAAIRYTDYSTSGGVTTWKVGLDYQVAPDIRFRGTVSRDIRAPNLLELFNSGSQNSNNQLYPSSFDGTTTPVVQITSGNPLLVPERALTQTYGMVLTPAFLDGFQLSVDYYDIKIDSGIQTVGAQQTIDNCYLNVPGFCQLVEPIGGAVRVRTPYVNLAVVKSAGIDIEARYITEVMGYPLRLSALATSLTAASTQASGGGVISTLGGNNDPRWRVNLRATYNVDDWTFFVQQRFISSKLVDAQRVEGVYVDDNTVEAAFYTDVTVTYAFAPLGTAGEIYFTVNNVTNQEPPKDVGPPTSFSQPGNRNVYDWIGRYFNVGLRFRY